MTQIVLIKLNLLLQWFYSSLFGVKSGYSTKILKFIKH